MDSQLVIIESSPKGIMGTNAQKTKWASPRDWEGMKQRIVYLYKTLDHPLWKVMNIMRDEHGFVATYHRQKMYKYYLRRWGVRKNLRAAQVQEFLQKVRLEDEETSVYFIGGVRVDRKRLETHRKRAPTSRSGQAGGSAMPQQIEGLSGTERHRPPSPQTTLLDPFLPETEKMLHAMRSYIGGSFDSGRWTRSHIPWQRDLIIAAQNSAWTSGRLMYSGYIPQAFRMINLCLDSCGRLLAADSPLFPMGMYTELFEFSKRHEAPARSIILFLRDLVLVKHQSKLHPLYVLFDTMSRMTSEQLCQCAWTLTVAYCASLCKELGANNAFTAEMSEMHGHCISWAAAYAPVEDSTAERMLQEHARALSAGGQTTFEALEARLRLANFFLDRRRYSEARSAAEEVIALDRGGGGAGADNAYLIDDCHRILFWVSRVDGSHEETAGAAGRWVGYCTSKLGGSHELTVDALGEVVEYFRDVGDAEAADQARREHEIAVGDMCERLERIGLEADACAAQKRTMLYGRTSQQGISA
ncbi:hypothetical protein VSDG_08238 [Cytospora chrysosperma]|uniref:Clr5 domain-containing protein n=1 Tax=Cytospora chrysosperma TaxID=252740 RepID=A0A423VG19_CYTCH|nr:hypothetical protein VSDG_08238 [Valsa sordida]